ncbi:MAG: tetratricopeptide repeat protein [Rhodanobacteraceae bacterium]
MSNFSFLHELKRRNVLRAAVLYAGAVWLLAQVITQLGPVFNAPDWIARVFLIAAAIGFPFWIAFAWLYELTPQGLKRGSEVTPDVSITRSTGRRLDRAIIVVLAVAVVLLLTNAFLWRKGSGLQPSISAAPASFEGIPRKSIAVLPLVNESGDKDQQYFSDGLSEDLITALSQFAGLKVISRNSSFQFRQSKDDSKTIGKKLGVAHLLEGSVRRVGGMVRISAILVNAADGSTLWAQHYDRPYTDLFTLQDEITQSVADVLKARLLERGGAMLQNDRPPSGNLDAYNAYLRGRFYQSLGTESDARKSIGFFDAAGRLDPRYAAAYAELGQQWIGLAAQYLGGEQAQQGNAKARTAIATALALNPGSAAAHRSRAYLLLTVDLDWRGADAEFRRALRFAPSDGQIKFQSGTLQAALGRPHPAIELTRQALLTDPRHANWHAWLSTYLASVGEFDQAGEAIRTAIALQPDAVSYYEQLAIVEILRGDAGAALSAARHEAPGLWQRSALALVRQVADDRGAADAALKQLLSQDSTDAAYQIAQVYALRRDATQTFAWLDRAWANRDPGIGSLLVDPFLLRYQDDARFAAFCRKAGLPFATDAKAMP